MIDKELAKIAGKLIGQTEVAVDGYSGREVTIEVTDGFWADRFYLVRGRLYAVSAFAAKSQANAKELTSQQLGVMRKYFESFRLKSER